MDSLYLSSMGYFGAASPQSQDMRPFRALYTWTDPATGRSAVIHEGPAFPGSWHDYHHESGSMAREILRLVAARDQTATTPATTDQIIDATTRALGELLYPGVEKLLRSSHRISELEAQHEEVTEQAVATRQHFTDRETWQMLKILALDIDELEDLCANGD